MGEHFFTPRSLARVANHVEWEDVEVVYKDGSTNYQRYMEAMAILYERWVRNWSLNEFREAWMSANGGDFIAGLQRICETLPTRISMLKGFYEGLWYGANPGRKPPARGWYLPVPTVLTDDERVMMILDKLLTELANIVTG